MTSSSNINFSSIRAQLKKAEKSLESDSKSKIFNQKYIESYEQEILADAQSLGVSSSDIQDILNTAAKYVPETLKVPSVTYEEYSDFQPKINREQEETNNYIHSVWRDPDPEIVYIFEYYHFLIVDLVGALQEINVIIRYFYRGSYDFLKDDLKLCQENCDSWLRQYKLKREPKKRREEKRHLLKNSL
jgi:hypothetical protein